MLAAEVMLQSGLQTLGAEILFQGDAGVILVVVPSSSGHKRLSVRVLHKADKQDIEAFKRKMCKRRKKQMANVSAALKFWKTCGLL